MVGPTVEFDTRELNATADSDKRFQLWVYLFVLAIVVGLSVSLAARDWRTLSPSSWYDMAAWGICTIVALTTIDALMDLRKGASMVRITAYTLELEYPGGKIVRTPSKSPSIDIQLFEWPKLPDQGYALRIGRVNTRIPREAREIIFRRAEELKLRIDTKRTLALSSAFERKGVRIRAGVPPTRS